MKKRKISISTIILIIVFLVGLSVMLYPAVSDYWNSKTQSHAIAEYDEILNNMDDKQYQKLLELDDVELTFDDKALEAIAETSLKRKTGARGLRAIMESIMMDIMYKAPSDETLKSCHITEDVVKGTGEPVCEHAEPDSESA